MLKQIKNHGNKIFLPCGRWLDKDEETTVTAPEAYVLSKTNKDIEILAEKKNVSRKHK